MEEYYAILEEMTLRTLPDVAMLLATLVYKRQRVLIVLQDIPRLRYCSKPYPELNFIRFHDVF